MGALKRFVDSLLIFDLMALGIGLRQDGDSLGKTPITFSCVH